MILIIGPKATVFFNMRDMLSLFNHILAENLWSDCDIFVRCLLVSIHITRLHSHVLEIVHVPSSCTKPYDWYHIFCKACHAWTASAAKLLYRWIFLVLSSANATLTSIPQFAHTKSCTEGQLGINKPRSRRIRSYSQKELLHIHPT